MRHHTSKSASDDFWECAKDFFPKLYRAKVDEMKFRSIPQFTFQRKKLNKNNVPNIDLEIGYLNKETKEKVVVKGEKTPVSRFNPQKFTKLYEMATVKV